MNTLRFWLSKFANGVRSLRLLQTDVFHFSNKNSLACSLLHRFYVYAGLHKFQIAHRWCLWHTARIWYMERTRNTFSRLDTPSELVHHWYYSTCFSCTRWQGVQPSLEIFQLLDAIEAEGTECKCLSKSAFKRVSTDKIRHINNICAPRTVAYNSTKITPKMSIYLLDSSQNVIKSLREISKINI